MLLAPDQKIYMSTGNGTNLLHTIHHPDEPGLNCDFRQHDVLLPAHFPFYLSNMPFYRLYTLVGSSCDTLDVQPPTVAFWRSEPDTSFLGIRFTDISYANPVSWDWNFGDGTFSALQSPVHAYPVPGIYPVCLKVCNGFGVCDTFCKQVEVKQISNTSQPELDKPPAFTLMPNPVRETLTLSLSVSIKFSSYQIIDVNGITWISNNLPTQNNKLEILVVGLPPGAYYIAIQSDAGVEVEKFIKLP
jgi:PKD repeat protein